MGRDAKTALVAGAAGFIGSAIARKLAREGLRVIALCRDVDKGKRRLRDAVRPEDVVGWDMADPVTYGGKVDAIVHAAGRGDPVFYSRRPAVAMRDTLSGCVNILDFAVRNAVEKFLLVSSGEVYGFLPSAERIRETDEGTVLPHAPRSAYPVGKMAAEALSLAYGREYGLHMSVARLCHVYGPGIDPDDSRIAAAFPRAAATGNAVVMKSRGEQIRSWCYIDDAAAAAATVLFRGENGGVYNVADESMELSVREFAERMAAAAGARVVFEAATEAERTAFNPMPRAVLDAEKIRALGWSPRTGPDAGFAATIAYFNEVLRNF